MLTRQRFERGLNYEAYKAQLSCYRDRFEAEERRLALGEVDATLFQNLPVTIQVLVLTEDRCSVAVDSLPLLARLAAEVSKLDVRIFVCSQHPDLAKHYAGRNERLCLPVLTFFGPLFQELGQWTQFPPLAPLRPPAQLSRSFLTAGEWNERIWEASDTQSNRERMHQWFRMLRDEQQQVMDQDLLGEWRQIIREGLSGQDEKSREVTGKQATPRAALSILPEIRRA